MKRLLLQRLGELSLLHGRDRSPEELALLVDLWAEALDGEERDEVARAFALYLREGERFPCPADILRLLPRCRAEAGVARERTALPEMTVSAPDAVRERARAISRGARTGTAAQRMGELLGRVLVMPPAGPEVRQ